MQLGNDHNVIDFFEKPVYPYNVSMGIYMFNRRVVECIPPNTAYGFDSLMIDLLRRKELVKAYPHDGYWLDLGRPDDYETAVRDFSSMRERFLRERAEVVV